MTIWTIEAIDSISPNYQAYYLRQAIAMGGGTAVSIVGAGFCLVPWFWPRRVGRLLVRMPKEPS
jgi:hypothetical protein